MGSLIIFCLYLTVFGVGVTILDLLGILSYTKDTSSKPKTTFIDTLVSVIRTWTYFCLGAGPTGLFVLLTKHTEKESFFWSVAGGTGAAVLAHALRRLYHWNQNSAHPVMFMSEKAVIITPISPGATGKALVRRFGKETEIWVRCKNTKLGFVKGAEVRIIAHEEAAYWIEPA
ncbi:MAG: hypothetical protein LBD29_09640 [Treponema sp.]|jgi:hypothetical protein|nr:hypothetical protein [Treponema sp.]